MTTITPELVRRRAEHNDGQIFSLEELSLHQLDIEKLEHLQDWCPDLKILYLQGNLITKIENVHRLKRLTYLNLALNNIEIIENLEGCEALEKLDLTLNFIWKLSNVRRLAQNYELRELYLTGNPCTHFSNYRSYVISAVPQLELLDGQPVLRSERIEAKLRWVEVEADILQQETQEQDINNEHCPEGRRRLHEEIRQARATKKPEKPSKVEKTPLTTTSDGRILNVNQAKVPFTLEDEDDCVRLTVKVPKYMDTSLMDVDVHPNHVRVLIKGQLLQLVLPAEICSDKAVAQRSQASGSLVVTMPKVEPSVPIKMAAKSPKSKTTDADDVPPLEAFDELTC